MGDQVNKDEAIGCEWLLGGAVLFILLMVGAYFGCKK